jgi:GT2 family glycosyltransferase
MENIKTLKNSMPYCAIVILNYNAKEYLGKCLSSLQKLNYPKNRYKIILVDNASTDGSVEFVRKNFPKAEIIENRKNLGFSAGNNVALRSVDSDYYVLLNPDTFVDKNWLINLVKVAESDDKVGLCSSKILMMDDKSRINYAGGLINFLGFSWPRGFNKKDRGNFRTVEETGFASGASMLIKRKVLEEVGFLDEDFFMYQEDVDYSWRARLLGYKVLYVPSSILYHKVSFSVKSFMKSTLKYYYAEMNRLETLLKNYSTKTLISLLPTMVLLETFLTLYFLARYKSPLKIQGFFKLIKSSKRILKKRYIIQKSRTVDDRHILQHFTTNLPRFFLSETLTDKIPDKLIMKLYKPLRSFLKFYYRLIKAVNGDLQA